MTTGEAPQGPSDLLASNDAPEMKPRPFVTLNDVQAFASALEEQGYSANTICRRLGAVKSLLSYGHSIGVLPVNVGAPLKSSKGKETRQCRYHRGVSPRPPY